MSVVVRFIPTNVTKDKYDESLRRLKDAGEFPPEGMDYHVAFGLEDNLRSAKSATVASSCKRSATGSCRIWTDCTWTGARCSRASTEHRAGGSRHRSAASVAGFRQLVSQARSS